MAEVRYGNPLGQEVDPSLGDRIQQQVRIRREHTRDHDQPLKAGADQAQGRAREPQYVSRSRSPHRRREDGMSEGRPYAHAVPVVVSQLVDDVVHEKRKNDAKREVSRCADAKRKEGSEEACGEHDVGQHLQLNQILAWVRAREHVAGELSKVATSDNVASADFEASEYDLGTTSIRLVRVGRIIQLVCSNKHDSKIIYAELSSKFMKDQDELRRG